MKRGLAAVSTSDCWEQLIAGVVIEGSPSLAYSEHRNFAGSRCLPGRTVREFCPTKDMFSCSFILEHGEGFGRTEFLRTSTTAPKQLKERDADFEMECVNLFSSYLHVLGVPHSIGAIYGLLFASPESLCFSDIVERLGVSKGSVSQGLTFLRQSGAVKVIEVAGDRREYFEPELGLRRLASGLIQEKVQPLAKESRGALARMRVHAYSTTGGQNKFQMERIRQLETWHKQLGRVLPVVQTILKINRS